jgi:hypothetical protein
MPSGTRHGDEVTADRRSKRARLYVQVAAGILATATILAVAQQAPNKDPNRSLIIPAANPVPDKNQQMEMQQKQLMKSSYEAANLERRKQIADDAARLLQLATDLKKEVDKTDKDTLSVNVIRKAEMIEKLAKGVKEKMKLTTGAS